MLQRAGGAAAIEPWAGTVTPGILLAQSALLIGAALVATAVMMRAGPRLSAAQLRWWQDQTTPPWRGARAGLLIGAAAAVLALLLAVSAGSAAWVSDVGTLGGYVVHVLATLGVLAPAALAEELIFRGVPLILLSAAFGRTPAIVALAALFAFAHAGNPNLTGLGVFNIALAGAVLGQALYAPGGLATAFGVHLGWNGALAALDAPVSGLPFAIPLLDFRTGGPAWWTGGAFGPEGGLAATLALGGAAAMLLVWTRKERA